jgi:glycosyltransferase involved in cell wall biosynthesis
MEIVFICPPVTVINGGIKYIFRMVETLCDFGYNAVVFEEKERRPTWFSNTAPIVGRYVLQPNPDQIYVLPEDQTHLLDTLKDWPQQLVIYSQNHFYSACRLNNFESYSDYNVTHLICSSLAIYEHARIRHPKMTAHVIPCSIDPLLFRPANKRNNITFMPRKRPVEATYIRDMFRHSYAQYRDWRWQELSNLNEGEVAKAMGEARVFLSLSRLEGFGVTPLEAMAAGSVVAGFTGIGGREYATKENGFWAEEDDFPTCIQQIQAAIELSCQKGPARTAYSDACQKTLCKYTPEQFRKAVKDVWEQILQV